MREKSAFEDADDGSRNENGDGAASAAAHLLVERPPLRNSERGDDATSSARSGSGPRRSSTHDPEVKGVLMSQVASFDPDISEDLFAEMEIHPLLDADGCVETLYYYLWKKDADGKRYVRPGIQRNQKHLLR